MPKYIDDLNIDQIYIYCRDGETRKIRQLLSEYPDYDINSQVGICDHIFGKRSCMNLLHIACDYHHLEIVKILLQQTHINVNCKRTDSSNMTALDIACRNGYPNIVKELLKHPKIDVNASDDSDRSVMDHAQHASEHHEKIIALLLNQPNILIKPSNFLMATYSVDLAKKLLAHNKITSAHINYMCPHNSRTALQFAYFRGDTKIVKVLLADHRTDIIPLYLSAYMENDVHTINLLLARDKIIISLCYAFLTNNIASVKLLLANERFYANPCINMYESLFYLAYKYSNIEILTLLLDDPRINVNMPDRDGYTPLYHVCRRDDEDLVNLFLSSVRVVIDKLSKQNFPEFFEEERKFAKISKAKRFIFACADGHLRLKDNDPPSAILGNKFCHANEEC